MKPAPRTNPLAPGRPLRARRILAVIAGCVAALACGVLRADSSPAELQTVLARPHVVGVGFRGPIRPADVERLRKAISLAGTEPLPARVIVFLDSGGGDGLAAMEIGRLLRYAKAHVFVTGRCASACILAFAGGVFRSAPAGSLGIHRGRLTTVTDGRVVDVDPGKSPAAKLFLTDAEAQIREHLFEMGMPDALFDAMLAVPSQSMRWLDAEEAARFGLTGFDPEYLAERSKELSSRYGIAEKDLVQRSDTVLAQCGSMAAQHPAFIACYRKQLLTAQ